MKRLMLAAAFMAITLARPETYREKEDFQYSRSSSDEGSKTGYYGAQRGNVGGNYERAHNMDSLAQNQMSGVVRQVEGELGDGSNTRTGSVYSAANSRGVYGSGHYDLSNLNGRNFQEGVSYGDSQLQSSSAYRHSSSASNNAYSRNQHSSQSRFDAAAHANQLLQSSNLQTADRADQDVAYDSNRNTGIYRKGYNSQSGYRSENVYNHNSNYGSTDDYGSTGNTRLISATPIRVVVRPGTRVDIPVAAHIDSSRNTMSMSDHNSIKSDAEVIGNSDYNRYYQTTNRPKHYESSYNYHKEWEKHDSSSSATPLNIPTNSELYEDTQGHQANNQYKASILLDSSRLSNAHSSNRYNSVASSQSQNHDYDSQYGLSSGIRSNAYNARSDLDNSRNLISVDGDVDSRPKSYESAYSYHKSWERQGDPYVIRPGSSDDQVSQALTSSTKNSHASHQYASNNHHQSHQSYANSGGIDCDCDENGHLRVARSADWNDAQQQTVYEGQQSQNLEDFGQQSQQLADFGEQSQQLADFGQQSQQLSDFGQQSQKLEDFGQQSQQLSDFGQQSQKLEDFGQQSQQLADFGQQSQNLEDFGQQSQAFEDFGQRAVNRGDNLIDVRQQTQNQWDKVSDGGQQIQNEWDKFPKYGQSSGQEIGQQSQDSWHTFEPRDNVDQHTQNNWNDAKNTNEQIQSTSLKNLNNEQTQNNSKSHDLMYNLFQAVSQTHTDSKPIENQIPTIRDNIHNLDNSQQSNINIDEYQNNRQQIGQNDDMSQQNHNIGDVEPDNTRNFNTFSSFYNSPQNQFIPNNFPTQSVGNQYSNSNPNPNIDYPMNTQEQVMSIRPFPNQSQGTTAFNFWHKIDKMEKNSTHHVSEISTNNSNGFSSSHNSRQNSEQSEHGSHFWQSSVFVENKHNNSKTDHETHDGKVESDKGRGDISLEDLPDDNDVTTTNGNKQSSDKTKEEIEELRKDMFNTGSSSLNLSDPSNNVHQQHVKVNQDNFEHQDLNQHNMEQQFEEFDHQHDSINQQNEDQMVDFGQQNEDINSQITEQQFGGLSQQHKGFNQQNEDQMVDFGQNNENLSQLNIEQQFEGVGSHNANTNQYNYEQQFEDKQKNENLNQQNIGQTFEQQNVDQMVDFGQHDSNLSQQNIERQFASVDQHNANAYQNNNEQQFEDKLKIENLNQQNIHMEQPLEDFSQHNVLPIQQNFNQQFAEVGQENENLSQQSQTAWGEHDNGQQVQSPWEPNVNQNTQSETQSNGQFEKITGQVEKEDIFYKENASDLHNNLDVQNSMPGPSKNQTEVLNPETTEAPSFWKSVGNKFKNAKDKVTSWFKS